MAPGIAGGSAYVLEHGLRQVPDYHLPADAVDAEVSRFYTAVEVAKKQLDDLAVTAGELPEAAAEEFSYLISAHRNMLSGSRLIRGVESDIRSRQSNAEAALRRQVRDIAAQFERLTDPYIAARVRDVRDIGERLVRLLVQTTKVSEPGYPAGAVIVAESVTPADVVIFHNCGIAAIATEYGGADDHSAILARALGLPAVVGVPALMQQVSAGEDLLVDGAAGSVIIRPSSENKHRLQVKQQHWLQQRQQLKSLKDLPAATTDGGKITLQANIELKEEIPMALEAGAEGIGLLRTEFMFMNRDDVPDEDEQADALSAIVSGMQGRPVTIRTLDVGGDKLAPGLNPGSESGVTTALEGDNPALGLRAIRYALKEPALLSSQLAACIRASAYGPVRILLPMVTSAEEVRTVRRIAATVLQRLQAKPSTGLEKRATALEDGRMPPIGVMIEVPAAAIAADLLARESDFFSIGTNDLTMYTLAVDRAGQQVADLFDPLHPAVIRLLKRTVAHAARAGIPVSLCGELAGDAEAVPLLLGLGMRDLSMSSVTLPSVKQQIRALSVTYCEKIASDILSQDNARAIRRYLRACGTG